MAGATLSENLNNCKLEETDSKEFDLDSPDGFKQFLKKKFDLLCTGVQREDSERDFTENRPVSLDMTSQLDADTGVYNFGNPRRGLALIINNEDFSQSKEFGDRPGSSYDASSLHKSFVSLGFDVELFHDLPGWKMVEVLRSAARNYDHMNADCFACCILSHGDETWSEREWDRMGTRVRMDLLFGTDGKALATKAVVEMFNNRNCPTLKNKPRLFFLQACRGDKYDDGQVMFVKRGTPPLRSLGDGPDSRDKSSDQTDKSTPAQQTSTPPSAVDRQTSLSSSVDPPQYHKPQPVSDTDATDAQGTSGPNGDEMDAFPSSRLKVSVSPAPLYKDCLIMYATPPGHYAWRRRTGAWFIQCLCKLFDSNVLGHVSLIRGLSYVCGKVGREYQSENPNNPSMHHKKEIPVVESMLSKAVFMSRKAGGSSNVPRYR